jgi:microcystin-dependent protein
MGVLYAKVGQSWEPILQASSNGGGGGGQWEPGDIKATTAFAATAGWLMLDGQAYANADTTYPALWAVAPASWKSGTTMTLPNAADRVLMGGGTLGALGGANARTLIEANLPAHDHTMAHTHTINHTHATATTSTTPDHDHTANYNMQNNTSAGGTLPRLSGAGQTTVNSIVPAGAHNHTVAVPAFSGNSGGASVTNTGNAGSGTALDTTPAHLRVNYMVKT